MTPNAHASSSTTHRSPLLLWLIAGVMLFAVIANAVVQSHVSPFQPSSQIHALQHTPALLSAARASVALPAALPDDDTQPPHLAAITHPPHIRLAWHLIAFLCVLGVCLPRQYLAFSLPRLGGWREHNLQYRFIHSR
ncbi:hypothetical protein [Salinivibrio sp. ES.052]|uniref:hypothetical protein n=1 Tax=Salinivibrio sp. ES.052 TaxID=1882823 RepID=UPI000929B52A|nr:hypothetical protein [Salinivibrio sp. ES.052]SIO05078.1 hypothetical protein SAMN05444724_1829 [Salinivibrio sp. ES.052]